MIMNSSNIYSIKNIAMLAFFCKICCIKSVCVGGRTCWVVKVSGGCDQEYFLMYWVCQFMDKVICNIKLVSSLGLETACPKNMLFIS